MAGRTCLTGNLTTSYIVPAIFKRSKILVLGNGQSTVGIIGWCTGCKVFLSHVAERDIDFCPSVRCPSVCVSVTWYNVYTAVVATMTRLPWRDSNRCRRQTTVEWESNGVESESNRKCKHRLNEFTYHQNFSSVSYGHHTSFLSTTPLSLQKGTLSARMVNTQGTGHDT